MVTSIDEIVYCAGCKYFMKSDYYHCWFCNLKHHPATDDDFCSWGEPKEEHARCGTRLSNLAVTFTCPKDEQKRDGEKCLQCWFCVHGMDNVFYCAWNIREVL